MAAPRGPKPELDREELRKGFRRWIGEALRIWPESIKDLYRLGVFEAQVEARHDTQALRAFLRAVEVYRALPEAERARRGDLRKACSRSLYAGGRSAMRLRRTKLARKLSFACIREDEGTDHVDPVHKLHLAARVCLATGELDHAERAARLALDGKGPPRRDYIFGLLSDIALARGDTRSACVWIEEHVPERRRDSATWRRLGDARLAAGDKSGACRAWQSALMRDRCGRHLTLVRLGRVFLEDGELGKAEDAFRKAAQFRSSRYMGEDVAALRGLEQVLEARGKTEELPRVRARLAKCSGADQEAGTDEGAAVA
jgi:tetratricopeptide (TPR) repeat protein